MKCPHCGCSVTRQVTVVECICIPAMPARVGNRHELVVAAIPMQKCAVCGTEWGDEETTAAKEDIATNASSYLWRAL